MWADISEHTVGRNCSTAHEPQTFVPIGTVKEDQADDWTPRNEVEEDPETTENSSIFYNLTAPFCTSI